MLDREKNWKSVLSIVVIIVIFFLGNKAPCKDVHHVVAGHQARNALKHRLDVLHRSEIDLRREISVLERQLESVKHQILDTEGALRRI